MTFKKHLYWFMPLFTFANTWFVYWLGLGEFHRGEHLAAVYVMSLTLATCAEAVAFVVNIG